MSHLLIRFGRLGRRAGPAADLDEVTRTVEGLARSRFSPSPEVLDRIEARVASAFRDARRPVPMVRPAMTGMGPRWRPWLRRWSAVMVALVAVAGSGAVASAESSPGRPLYGVKLAVESALLPAAATDRVEAQLTRLDRRIDEAVDAGNDDGAVLDAIRAYRATLGELIELADAHPGQGPVVVPVLDRQISSLEALLAATDGTAGTEVSRALSAARVARAFLDPRREPGRSSVESSHVGHETRAP